MSTGKNKPQSLDYAILRNPKKQRIIDPYLDKFVEKWQDSLRRAKARSDRGTRAGDLWEGEIAARALEKTGCWTPIMRRPDAKTTRDVIKLVVREIDIYRSLSNRIVETNDEFRSLRDLLMATRRNLEQFKSTVATEDLTRPLIEGFRAMIDELPVKQQAFWNDRLDFSEDERSREWVNLDSLASNNSESRYMLPDGVIEIEAAIFNWDYPKRLEKEANLDTRLQVRLAVIFRVFFKKLSWNTISRLVVLAYIAGGLVEERESKIFPSRLRKKPLIDDKDELTPAKIVKKLYKAMPADDADPDAFFLAPKES